jgi:uncharacterized protein YbjT (DUF2867 family)
MERADEQVAVAGSLGDQGGAAARSLHEAGLSVRALSRNVSSAAAERLRSQNIRVIDDDLEQPGAVWRDLNGVRFVFGALTPFEPGGLAAELRQLRNLAGAAADVGVERFVYSAVGDPDQDVAVSPGAVWEVERMLIGYRLPLVLLRPAFFMENIDEFALRRATDGSLELRMPMDPDTCLQWIALDDVGGLVRLIYERADLFGPKPIELAGDQLTLSEAVDLLSACLGEDVKYRRIPLEAVEDDHARGMYKWFMAYAAYEADIERIRRLRPSMLTFRQWLETGHLDPSKVERP